MTQLRFVARRRFAAGLVGLALLTSACASSGDGRLEFGIRRLALDVAFVDEDAAPPPEPERITRLVPGLAEFLEPDNEPRRGPDTSLGDPLSFGLCPEAAPEETVGVSVSPAVIEPPLPGAYPRRNSGFIEIQGASVPLRIPYPLFSAWNISEARDDVRPGPLGTQGALEPATQFTVTKSLGAEFSVTETYEIGAEALLLLERVTKAGAVTTRFRTDPPLEYFNYGAEGDDWTSAGADTENGFGVVIQGTIADRQVIDVCGELVDTFAINYREVVVNLETGQTSGTNETVPSTVYFAPQFGGLVVREDMHTIQNATDPDGAPLVIRFDYVSTLTGTKPVRP